MPTPHSTNNYTVGKGILTIAEWSGGSIGAYADVGNCISLEVDFNIERLPHFSSRQSYREKDKNPIIQTEYTANFNLDEIAAANLNRFLLGELQGDGRTIYGLQGANKEFALHFASNNPIGPNQVWDFWKCTLSPNGAMQLIGEEWMTMQYTAEGLADTAGHPESPYFTVVTSEPTSTTTTTT